MRLYGVPESTEGAVMVDYINNLLTTQLSLPDEVNLEIQRAHRAPVAKPDPNSLL